MGKTLSLLILTTLLILTKDSIPSSPILIAADINVLGESTESLQTLPSYQPIHTQSRFEQKLEEKSEIVSKKTVYQDDPQIEAGEEKILDEGEDGKKTTIIKVTYYEGKEYDREVASTEIIPAKEKKILRGTKIVWKEININGDNIHYWKKMRVYATHYDSHCLGCDEWTAIGMRAGKGVIAVDPTVIKLRSKVYIPGYGFAIAGDTGGAIKGKIIDLGFEDARTAGWYAHYIDIYLL